MEVRVGERLLWLTVLSSLLFVDSALGKYVRGVVNTKEVSALHLLNLFPRDEDSVGDRLDCVSRCLCGSGLQFANQVAWLHARFLLVAAA